MAIPSWAAQYPAEYAAMMAQGDPQLGGTASATSNINPSQLAATQQAMGTQSGGVNAGQGLGQSIVSQVPAYLQGVSSGSVDPNQLGSDPVFQSLVSNGYLNANGTAASGAYNLGFDNSGYNYYPSAVGTGLAAHGSTPQFAMAPNNPLGVSSIGAQDVHELYSPSQLPQAFGTTSIGTPTVNKLDLAQNQDWISRYLIPAIQAGAGLGFAGLGGFGDLSSLLKGGFNLAGQSITGHAPNPLNFASLGARSLSQLLSGGG